MRDVISSLMGNPLSHHEKKHSNLPTINFSRALPAQESFLLMDSAENVPPRCGFSREWHFIGKPPTSLCLKKLLHLYWHCDTCFLSISNLTIYIIRLTLIRLLTPCNDPSFTLIPINGSSVKWSYLKLVCQSVLYLLI